MEDIMGTLKNLFGSGKKPETLYAKGKGDQKLFAGKRKNVEDNQIVSPIISKQKVAIVDSGYATLAQKNTQAWESKDSSILHILSSDKDYNVRMTVARNKNTSLEDLMILSKDSQIFVRQQVMGNPSTPDTVLADGIKDDCLIKEKIAERDNLSPEIFSLLIDSATISDSDNKLLRSLASNKKATAEDLNKIYAKANGSFVLEDLARNNNTPSNILSVLAKTERNSLRNAVAKNKNTSIEDLEFISQGEDIDSDVKRSLIKNENTPNRIISRLSRDLDDDVSYYAKERLSKIN